MKKLLQLGITQKLLLSFGLVVGTTLLATVIAVRSYGVFSDSLSEITSVSVPIMSDSMATTQLAVEFSAAIPLLTSANDQQDRVERYDTLVSIASRLEEQIMKADNLAGNSSSTESVIGDISFVKEHLQTLNTAVDARIDAREMTWNLMGEINLIQSSVNNELLAIATKSTLDFENLTKTKFEENRELLDSLLEDRIRQLVNALSLQNAVLNAAMLVAMNQSEGLEAATKAVSGYRTQLLPYHVEDVEQLDKELNEFISLVNAVVASSKPATDGLGRLPANERQRRQVQVQTISKRIISALSPAIDTWKFLTMLDGDELKVLTDESLPLFIQSGISQLTALLELRAELNTVSGTLGQALMVGNLPGLTPLMEQYQLSENRIGKILPQTSSVQGMYEVSDQISDLFSLGDVVQGVFHHRMQELTSELAIDDSRKALEQDQSAIINKLVKLVFDNRENVAQVGLDASEKISSSQLQLILVSLASVLTTVLVFWLLVSRSLLRRLHQIINALKSLAVGKYDVSVSINGNDELTELAQTIEVFRKTGMEAQQLHQQKEQQAEQLQLQKQEKERFEKERLAQSEREDRHAHEQAEIARQRAESLELQGRVDRLLAAVNAASNGDLNHPIDTTGDDLPGQMGRALDSLFAEMRSSMQSIDNNSVQLNQASDTLASLSSNMSELSSATAENSHDASQVSDTVDASINTVVSTTEQLSTSIREIVLNTTEAESVALEAVELAHSTDTTVRKLSDSSAGISSVIKVITSIAEQTNLLALNATIEAARAGEAGKGFAVVAGEVKELAKGTAAATEEIESRILDIQTDTESAVTAIQSIYKIVTRISEIQSLISVAVNDQEKYTQDIGNSVTQTASSSETISALIREVASKAKAGQETSNDVKAAAHELSDMAAQLQQLVSHFRPSEHSRTGSDLAA
ncbi:MAG: methyl-accepting chemotaxis protein [Granulosicoccus sp.]